MIGRSEEYEKMFRLEQQLWWYRILHESVGQALLQRFGTSRDITILDAGCGTGGMLNYLRQRGYTNVRGVDGSTDAVAFCQERHLDASLLNLNDLASYAPEQTYDAIICNDVFCYFDDPHLTRLLAELAYRLKPGGILISNNNAFNVFYGQHDLAVGSTRRFVQADFERLLPPVRLRIQDSTYWSLALAPLILLIRQWQRLQLRVGLIHTDQPASDVYLPGKWINEMFYHLVRTEQKLLRRTPFGSSLFMVIEAG